MQLVGFTNSLASGEIAPEAWERSELTQVQTGCEEARNMVGLPAGPCVSRGGFWRRGAPKFQATARRHFPWLVAGGEGLVLEFGELYFRVWTARGAMVETTPGSGVPYEQGHGYSEADLAGLRLKQVGDIGFITSKDGLGNVILKRFANNAWNATQYDYRNGPYLAENDDPTKTLTLTALGGGLYQVDASFPKFSPAYVGSKLRLRPPGGGPGLKTWAPNTLYGAESILSVGRVYSSPGGTSGNTPPTHESGTVSDGGVDWTFEHDGQVSLAVAAYTSPTQVTALAESTPPLADAVPTPNWSDGAFGAVHGFPTALTAVVEERLVQGGTLERPDTLEFSRTAGFDPVKGDFKAGLGTGLVVPDDAARVVVGDNRARIVWALDCVNLIVGSEEAEWIVSGDTLDDPITPASVKPRRISSFGSADVMPVLVQGPPSAILHVAKGATELRELVLGRGGEGDTDGRDLSILAQHLYGKGMVELAWSRADKQLWIRHADGSLSCLTYHREHQVIGVRRQEISGGFVAEGICCSPGPDGRDRLHVAAVRVKNETVQRQHLVLAERAEGLFLDAANEFVADGPPATVISGLSWLEGETVLVLGDGAKQGPFVVSGGAVTLPHSVTRAFVGLPCHRRFKSLPFDPNHDGSPTAKKQRPTHVHVVLGCVEAVVRSEAQDEGDERQVPTETVNARRASDLTPIIRRKREKVFLGSGSDRDVRVIVETLDPYDLAVYALRPSYEAN